MVVNTSEGVLITAGQPLDPPGPHILYVNDAFLRMTGYEAEEVIGQSPRILQGPQTSRQELDRLRAALESKEQVEVEIINYRKDGSKFWVEMSIAPVFDGQGTCTHFVAVQRDVTGRKRAEAALQVAKEELESRVARRTSQILRANEQLHKEIINRRKAEAKVRQRLAVEQSLAEISTRLVEQMDFRAVLPGVLRDVAAMVDARRVALVFLGDGREEIGEIYEWCSPDAQPLERTFLTSIIPSFAWMREQLEENRNVFFENPGQMPLAAAAGKQIIQKMGTQSVAAFPLQVDGKLAAILVSSNFVRKDGELTSSYISWM